MVLADYPLHLDSVTGVASPQPSQAATRSKHQNAERIPIA